MFVATEFAADAALLVAAYCALGPRYATVKQRAWILTSISSGILTLSSLPYLYAFLTANFDVLAIPNYPSFAPHIARLFQAYLVVDLVLGCLYYPKYFNLVSGWIHHIVYVFVLYCVLKYDWTHVFCLAAILELPTFLLAIASIYSSLRSDVLFAIAFFSTRIVFHLVLLASYITPYGRASINGDWGPASCFIAAFPLHVSWFHGCIRGFIRRHKKALAAKAAEAGTRSADVTPPDTPLPTPRDEDVGGTKDGVQSPKAAIAQLPGDSEPFTLVPPRARDAMLDLRLLRHLAPQQPVPLRIRAMLASASEGRYARLAEHAAKLYESVEPQRLAAFRARVSRAGAAGNKALREEVTALREELAAY